MIKAGSDAGFLLAGWSDQMIDEKYKGHKICDKNALIFYERHKKVINFVTFVIVKWKRLQIYIY